MPTIRRAWIQQGLRLGFAAQLAALDLVVRGGGAYLARPRLLGGLAGSMALLGLAASLVRRRPARIALALGLGVLVVGQLAYYRYYHGPLDAQVAMAARQAWSDVRPMLLQALPKLGAGIALVAGIEYGLLRAVAPLEVPHGLRRWALLGCALCGFLVCGSPRDATLEVRAVHALGALGVRREAAAAVGRKQLPELESTRRELPNVLLLLSESLRASDGCQAPGCPTSPELDRTLPDRVTLTQARTVASYSWLALSAVISSRTQVGPRAEIAAAPDIFDFARAARARGARYSLRYWSSQLASVFEREDLAQTVDELVTAETLTGGPLDDIENSVSAGLDREIARKCERSFEPGPKPWFVVIYLAGTHAPYFFDDADPPYQPWQRTVTWSGMERLHAAYLNSIREQDRTVAACFRSFLHATAGKPWLVVYSSDHGESFGERGAIHHGQNLYDEQLRVPLLIAHGGGALSDAQAEALRAAASRFVTHLDLAPTLLDAMGLLDHFALRSSVAAFAGRSLLRPLSPAPLVPITNCTEAYACPLNTWGMLAEGRKLISQAWDNGWRCMSLLPEEHEVEIGECADLRAASRTFFPRLPCGTPNGP
jgi:hypothetical protein